MYSFTLSTVYIYIYIYRERERERENKSSDLNNLILNNYLMELDGYIYIYIYIFFFHYCLFSVLCRISCCMINSVNQKVLCQAYHYSVKNVQDIDKLLQPNTQTKNLPTLLLFTAGDTLIQN